jgi:transposase
MSYGTVIVDLERHRVVDLLADRSAASTADWLRRHKEVEVVSRDRTGLYADGARQGAPQGVCRDFRGSSSNCVFAELLQ